MISSFNSKYLFKNRVSDKSEVISQDKKSSKFIKNISLKIYTFYKFIILNNIIIIDNMNFLKYKEFDYHQFETQIIQKLDKMISDDKYNFEYISKSILIDTKKIFVRYNILIIFKNNFYWMKIEWEIEHWILENKKKIIIKLTILYKKTRKSDSENSDNNKSFKKKIFIFVYN